MGVRQDERVMRRKEGKRATRSFWSGYVAGTSGIKTQWRFLEFFCIFSAFLCKWKNDIFVSVILGLSFLEKPGSAFFCVSCSAFFRVFRVFPVFLRLRFLSASAFFVCVSLRFFASAFITRVFQRPHYCIIICIFQNLKVYDASNLSSQFPQYHVFGETVD